MSISCWRRLSKTSSFSCWCSFWRSPISLAAFWNLSYCFSMISLVASSSSAMELYYTSAFIIISSWAFFSSTRRFACFRCSLSYFWSSRFYASCSASFSCNCWPPIMSLLFISSIILASSSLSRCSASKSSYFDWSSDSFSAFASSCYRFSSKILSISMRRYSSIYLSISRSASISSSVRILIFLPLPSNLAISVSIFSSTDSTTLCCSIRVYIWFIAYVIWAPVAPDYCIAYNMSFKFWISLSYYFKSASFGSSLILGLFLIDLARSAYLRVLKVSS